MVHENLPSTISNRPMSSFLSAMRNCLSRPQSHTSTMATQYWSVLMTVKQGYTTQTSRHAYKYSTMKVGKSEIPCILRLKHDRTRRCHCVRCLWSMSLSVETFAEISPKSHAFEDPDHFLIATALGRNSYYAIYLWDTTELGNCHLSDKHGLTNFI